MPEYQSTTDPDGIGTSERARDPMREVDRSLALSVLELTIADMAEVRAGLLREMPGRMDALAEKIDEWCRGCVPAAKELRRYKEPTDG